MLGAIAFFFRKNPWFKIVLFGACLKGAQDQIPLAKNFFWQEASKTVPSNTHRKKRVLDQIILEATQTAPSDAREKSVEIEVGIDPTLSKVTPEEAKRAAQIAVEKIVIERQSNNYI